MNKAIFLFICIFFFVSHSRAYAQSITGTWKGKSYVPGERDDTTTVYLEIQNGDTAGQFTGTSTAINENGEWYYFYTKATFKGAYDSKDKKYLFTEIKIIDGTGLTIPDKYSIGFVAGKNERLAGTINCIDEKKDLMAACATQRRVVFSRSHETIPERKNKTRTSTRTDTVWTNPPRMKDTLWVRNAQKTRWEYEKSIIISGTAGDRDLQWSDFTPLQASSSPFAAETFWTVKNDFDILWMKNDTIGLSPRPLLYWDERSWSLTGKQTNELLRHEELHFIIGKLCLLQLYKVIKSTPFNRNNVSEKLSRLSAEVTTEFRQMGSDYDLQTDHGRNKKEQKIWDDRIMSLLQEARQSFIE
ncbi:MAG: DUF922 domain-containing protein [Chitinophagaceae bacterium]|nr:DUF922 domain-containing protein [Chitinophagaceae bacterium]